VIIGGSMETGSLPARGRKRRRRNIFQHRAGSGRTMSRTRRPSNGTANNCSVILEARPVLCPAARHGQGSPRRPACYKNIDEVIAATELARI